MKTNIRTNNDVKRRYESGETMAQIGQRYGVSAMAVSLRLRRIGVKTRKQGEYLKQIALHNSAIVLAALSRHEAKGEHPTQKELEKETGLSATTIKRVMREELHRRLNRFV